MSSKPTKITTVTSTVPVPVITTENPQARITDAQFGLMYKLLRERLHIQGSYISSSTIDFELLYVLIETFGGKFTDYPVSLYDKTISCYYASQIIQALIDTNKQLKKEAKKAYQDFHSFYKSPFYDPA